MSSSHSHSGKQPDNSPLLKFQALAKQQLTDLSNTPNSIASPNSIRQLDDVKNLLQSPLGKDLYQTKGGLGLPGLMPVSPPSNLKQVTLNDVVNKMRNLSFDENMGKNSGKSVRRLQSVKEESDCEKNEKNTLSRQLSNDVENNDRGRSLNRNRKKRRKKRSSSAPAAISVKKNKKKAKSRKNSTTDASNVPRKEHNNLSRKNSLTAAIDFSATKVLLQEKASSRKNSIEHSDHIKEIIARSRKNSLANNEQHCAKMRSRNNSNAAIDLIKALKNAKEGIDFDSLNLKTLLESKIPLAYFMRALIHERSSENLLFYIDVCAFEKKSLKDQKKNSRRILKRYFSSHSKLELNVDGKTRYELIEKVKDFRKFDAKEDERGLFEGAKQEVQRNLESSFWSFKRSETFSQLKNDYKSFSDEELRKKVVLMMTKLCEENQDMSDVIRKFCLTKLGYNLAVTDE